ncbi:MAG: protein translocase subunit SecD, partial [Dehalococcoidia bacterium]|nr:protein translocase subunit SecD [Dehalococcoidia bacterium]
SVMAINPISLPLIGEREGLVLGLDLRGGVYLEYQADFSDVPAGEQEGRLEETKRIVESRVNKWGVTEPNIYTMSPDRIVVQLPGFADIEGARELVGKTAELIFREPATSGNTSLAAGINVGDTQITLNSVTDFAVGDVFGIGSGGTAEAKTIIAVGEESKVITVDSGFDYEHSAGEPVTNLWVPAMGRVEGEKEALTGKYLLPNSYVELNRVTNEPVVAFQWDATGAELFYQITARLYRYNKPLGIFLDNELIAAPIVKAQIRESGIIEGLTLEDAQRLAIQLNTGALPLTLHEVRTQKVDPTLGADSLRQSLVAGVIGLVLVMLFMILYYRIPGTLACIALIVYAAILLTVFKLWPVTLTLAGIAALILSLGMAVDANVLIFERMKEEIRSGRSLAAAIETGFARAWLAIRDSNISTLITCVILYWFGNTFGAAPVMGFALTLGIGVAVSMFTAIVVTRSFLRAIVFTPVARRISLFRP